MNREDHDHLRVLGIFYYIVAGLIALAGLLPIVHLLTGLAILRDVGNHSGQLFGLLLIGFGACAMVIPLTMAACCVIAGTRLRTQRSLLFCQVVAGVTCIFFPVGTVRGVLTLIVLSRPEVRDSFDRLPAVGFNWENMMREE